MRILNSCGKNKGCDYDWSWQPIGIYDKPATKRERWEVFRKALSRGSKNRSNGSNRSNSIPFYPAGSTAV